jgi:hypothetical protein
MMKKNDSPQRHGDTEKCRSSPPLPVREGARGSRRAPKALISSLCLCVSVVSLLFITPARAEPRGWPGWIAVMWQAQPPAGYAALPGLGVGGGMLIGNANGPTTVEAIASATAPMRAAGLRYYVENIATDFYAAYHRFIPGKPNTWLYQEALARSLADPADPAALIRTPSLADPVWRDRIAARLAEVVHNHGQFRPLYYSLGDETGLADLAAHWDFDFSSVSLDAFRVWLRRAYPSLDALNREWGTGFATWDAVRPETTTEAMRRTDDNFAAWSDFRDFMDGQFAEALRVGTDAVHRADPAAVAAIEGAQVPGSGGYDYGRLAHAVDAIEGGDQANSEEIARSFNPDLMLLSTSFGSGPEQVWQIWREFLLGARGLVIWDSEHGFITADGKPGPRAAALAPTLRELSGRLGTVLAAARPVFDPVAILYSPASQRVHWLLDNRAPAGWTADEAANDSEKEGVTDTPTRRARAHAADLFARLGVAPRWIAPDGLAALERDGIRALVLPEAIALAPAEAAAIRTFAAHGGLVFAEGAVGQFDGHGRRLAGSPLAGVPLAALPAGRDADALDALAAQLSAVSVRPRLALSGAAGGQVADVTVRLFAADGGLLIGLQRDFTTGGGDEAVTLALPRPGRVRDLRRNAALGTADRVPLTLDATEPTLLEVDQP